MVTRAFIRPFVRGRMALKQGRLRDRGLEDAPFQAGLMPVHHPEIEVKAVFAPAADGHRVRIAMHRRRRAKGTILIFPGRGECLEKWEDAMAALSAMGYASIAAEWRGQGLSGRLGRDNAQHADSFADYQLDAEAMRGVAEDAGLPKPWSILAHSMGGAIAFRSLHEGFPADSAVLSAPMFGFDMGPMARGMAFIVRRAAAMFGGGDLTIPGMGSGNYVLEQPFEGNLFTTHAPSYAALRKACEERPDLHVGHPSVQFGNAAMAECRSMALADSPAIPALFLYGSDEMVVSAAAMEDRFARWPGAERLVFNRGRHDVLMESPSSRSLAMERIRRFLEGRRPKYGHAEDLGQSGIP